ncbi:MAG: 3'-5' exonuclease [Thermoplasmatota archaeon]|nr:3'-5' exonuclease [Halobacteriales archaeon]
MGGLLGAAHVVAFDLETTGLDTEKARIVEFCFIELDPALNEVSRWTETVHPGMPIPAETVKVHGISDEMVRDRPRFAAFAGRIQALVQDAVLVAHNHKFDLEILSRELARSGQPGLKPNHPCIDTQRVEAFVNSHSLAETYRRYVGSPFDGAHRSAADTAACIEVLRRQREVHAGKLPADLDGLVVASLDRLRNPDRAPREFLDHGHWIFTDAKGDFHYNRGKYKGTRVFESRETRDYLRWMRDNPGVSAGMEKTLDSLLAQARSLDGAERGVPVPISEGQGKFHRSGAGHLAFSFGRYRGCPALEMHECAIDLRRGTHADYLRWMFGKADFSPEVKALVAQMLAGASPGPPAIPAPSPGAGAGQ